ncbi:MAG: hypothetical protein AAFU54_04315 [Chloroflexota bacterium]
MDIVEKVARQLTDIKCRQGQITNDNAWAMAQAYVGNYEALVEHLRKQEIRPTPQTINRMIRSVDGYEGVGTSWLSMAKRTAETFPEFFRANSKKKPQLPYYSYRQIATSRVPNKQNLRRWAEKNNVTRAELREEICRIVDEQVSKPDFELKVSNHWKFGNRTIPNGFEGGIHPGIVANLVHYHTDPGDTIIDPMAGGGTTSKIMELYEYFRIANPALEHSGPRTVLMSDINPAADGVVSADATQNLPWDDDVAELAIIDPPYWRVAENKYGAFGETVEEWRKNIASVIRNCTRVVHAKGAIAVITDDFLRGKLHHPLSAYVVAEAMELGLSPIATYYNPYPNFVFTMGPLDMYRVKKARTAVNEMKIIHVFTRSI